MRSRPNKRNKDLWCHFHNDHDHSTDKCGSLKRAIKALIKRGQLRKFVAHKEGQQQTPPAMEEIEDREENTGTINTISGGLPAGGSSGQAQKVYAREVCVTSHPPNKKQKTMPVAMITFLDNDSKDIKIPHDDPLVITIKVGNFDVKRVLVDNGSSAEVLFYDKFKKMNIPTNRLRKMDTSLLGSTYHLKMKFPTEHRIEEVKGDQTIARQCYMASCRSKNKEALIIEDLREDTTMQRGKPVEELVSIEVYPGEKKDTLGRFMARSVERCLPFFKAIRKAKNFAWTDDCQKSFEELKIYLSSPPLLLKPLPEEDLFLYLSVTEVVISTVLVREDDGIKKPIYYVSKILQDVETRYSKIDKIALAFIISARRLRLYFQCHTIVVLTDQPLRKVLLNPKASGRLVNLSVELGEFDIQYKPRTEIKAQALADFIIECTSPEDPPQLVISEVPDPWNLYVDGSSVIGSSGAEIILISPEGFVVEYSFRFGFQASNKQSMRPSSQG
ncbi:hypothetical protein RJ639_022878 [Escallonia herrerae]|uniref:Reverse transcriptase/retrotransposon-derived protein RNase H-like domain-containing protein n=1 Tax=Escallonia herrerae TaxID=1293975 RepID=A0AA88UZF8_9ASTE|nr:hypothetical protein RJ639_022878 [Escallonia herrerae]